jgi:hypothetical protein
MTKFKEQEGILETKATCLHGKSPKVCHKDYKGVYRLASKVKDKGFEADLYKKH